MVETWNNSTSGDSGKIKVGAVSYLNTRPLIYGFQQGMMAKQIDLVFDYPSNIASQLLNNKIDIGLVPVAILPLMPQYHIITNYCIGCDGAVASVCLFSEVPIQQIKTVLLDYQSRTSVALLKILLKEHWNITPRLLPAEKDFEKKISGTTAGLVIGDRAFKQIPLSKYHYDLGLAWQQFTGLPFVFAVWVSNKKLSDAFVNDFNKATQLGLLHLAAIAKSNYINGFDLYDYYTNYISYQFDEKKQEALQKFLKLLHIIPVNT